jgi:predicted glycoside hydrolase/deacetylase ChbG (UPF0249 family)
MTRPPRVLALCADDFGLSAGVSRGIVRLARQGRLNAVSCLANAKAWPGEAPRLADLPGDVDVGLHFNLTEGEPLSAELRRHWPHLPDLPRLIVQAHLRRLPRAALAAELAAQWAAFSTATRRGPAFVDGHQHVHHLPIVREVLLDAIARAPAGTAVRNTGRVPGPGFALKRALIAGTGGRALLRRLLALGVPHNAALLGVYDFAAADYRAWMTRWLAAVPADGALLFCHPGDADVAVDDAIAAARPREAAYLGSDRFTDDLAQAGVTLGRVWHADAR